MQSLRGLFRNLIIKHHHVDSRLLRPISTTNTGSSIAELSSTSSFSLFPLSFLESTRRISIIRGTVIARRNAGLNTTIRLRRLVAGVSVESLFPLYSPTIKEMKVLGKKKVRRAKLYYLRDRMKSLKKPIK